MIPVAVVVTARASYARCKTVLEALRAKSLDTFVVCGGSAVLPRYGNVSALIEADGFDVLRTYTVAEGETLQTGAISTGLAVQQFAAVFADIAPSLVVVIADRREVLGAAIAASYQNIPLLHMLGGERSGSIDDKVRYAITALADYHAVPHKAAADRVCDMLWGIERIPPGSGINDVVVTGCPSFDLAKRAEVFEWAEPYGVVILHPDTTKPFDLNLALDRAVIILKDHNLRPVVFQPCEDPGGFTIAADRWVNVDLVHNFPAEKFYGLLAGADCITGNSSVLTRECRALGWHDKITVIGDRQEGRDDCGLGDGTAGQQIADWIEEIVS